MNEEVKRRRLIESSIRRGVKRSQAYYDFLASQPVKYVGPKKWRYYPCAHCHGWFSRGKLDLDHIEPVVDPEVGFVDWNSYVERSYCGPEGFQHNCRPCHRAKTKAEGVVRTQTKRASKAESATPKPTEPSKPKSPKPKKT